ncbi:MAG: DUF2231 domain-containing protein [Capsulimonadales bacterium]|nr:DUF2231 domain-containing protein [Capsulimonadales bacterium]
MSPKEDPIAFWQHIHGATAHFPIVGLILAFCFDMGATIFRRPHWRTIGFWTLLVAAVVSVPAVLSGLTGQNGWFGVSRWMSDSMERHRNVAIVVSVLAVLLSLWRIVRKDELKGTEWLAYLVLLTVATGIISYTGWLGGYVARGY